MPHPKARSDYASTIQRSECSNLIHLRRQASLSCFIGHPRPMQQLSALPSRKIDPAKFTAEQLAFLERKRAYKAGETLNPLQSFSCPECGGKGNNSTSNSQTTHTVSCLYSPHPPTNLSLARITGTVVCWECSGAGVNHRDIVEEVMGYVTACTTHVTTYYRRTQLPSFSPRCINNRTCTRTSQVNAID